MGYWERKLIRQQIDSKLMQIKELRQVNADSGWIKLIREALGMTTTQLGKRAGIDQSRITRLEKAETEGDLKLSSLKKMAEGLDMQFVYAFVPKTSLESMVQEQAMKIALKRMKKVSHTMKLEDQELSEKEKAKVLEDLVQKILIEEPKDFWDQ